MRVGVQRSSIHGTVRVPSSKSLTHRAIVCGLLASGTTRIINPLLCDDTEATLRVAQMMGAEVSHGCELEVTGPSLLVAPLSDMDCKGSGTTLRLFTALSALTGGRCVLTGDKTLRRRPIGDLLDALRQLGVDAVSINDDDSLPVMIHGRETLSGTVLIRGDVSSQYITGLLFACSRGDAASRIELTTRLESRPYVELTIATMRHFGVTVTPSQAWSVIDVPGLQEYQSTDYIVEGDYSSAAFLMAAGALTGSVVTTGLRSDSLQGDIRIVALLRSIGASVEVEYNRVRVSNDKLRSFSINVSDVPDFVPVLVVLATQAHGVSHISSASRLRFKESDRLATISHELGCMGARIEQSERGLVITGPTPLHGRELDPHGDHRIAMAGVVAGLVAEGVTVVTDIDCVKKSYPGFLSDMQTIGAQIEEDSGKT